MKNKVINQRKIGKALGSSKIINLNQRPNWPLGFIALANAIRDRLVSRGGRPSDPHWDTRRLVPFRRRTWKLLAKEAQAISGEGRKVGPAQLAAIMIEENLTSAAGLIAQGGAQLQFRIPRMGEGVQVSFDTGCAEKQGFHLQGFIQSQNLESRNEESLSPGFAWSEAPDSLMISRNQIRDSKTGA